MFWVSWKRKCSLRQFAKIIGNINWATHAIKIAQSHLHYLQSTSFNLRIQGLRWQSRSKLVRAKIVSEFYIEAISDLGWWFFLPIFLLARTFRPGRTSAWHPTPLSQDGRGSVFLSKQVNLGLALRWTFISTTWNSFCSLPSTPLNVSCSLCPPVP